MRRIALLLVLTALAASAPAIASADPGGRHGHGGRGGDWRGDGRYQGRPSPEDEGRWRGPGQPDGPYDGGPAGSEAPGRWGGRYPPQGGPLYAGPPPTRGNSLGEGWREQQNEAREGVQRGEFKPLGGVLSELRRRMPGRQLDTGIEQGPDGRPVYRVRWAARNGQRVDFIVDARTGAILAEEGR